MKKIRKRTIALNTLLAKFNQTSIKNKRLQPLHQYQPMNQSLQINSQNMLVFYNHLSKHIFLL